MYRVFLLRCSTPQHLKGSIMAKPNVKNSAAPTTEAATPAKRGRKPGTGASKKIDFVTPEGATYVNDKGLFTVVPPDFDRKKHKPLSKKQFADEAYFLTLKADEFEARAKRLRAQVEDMKKLGGMKDKAKAKKLLSLQKRMAELQASILADDPGMEEFLAKLGQINAQKSEESGEVASGEQVAPGTPGEIGAPLDNGQELPIGNEAVSVA